MRFSEYYRGIVVAARAGGPTRGEARRDYRRSLEARWSALATRW